MLFTIVLPVCQTTEHFSFPKELHVTYQIPNYKFYKDSNDFFIFSCANSNMT